MPEDLKFNLPLSWEENLLLRELLDARIDLLEDSVDMGDRDPDDEELANARAVLERLRSL